MDHMTESRFSSTLDLVTCIWNMDYEYLNRDEIWDPLCTWYLQKLYTYIYILLTIYSGLKLLFVVNYNRFFGQFYWKYILMKYRDIQIIVTESLFTSVLS